MPEVYLSPDKDPKKVETKSSPPKPEGKKEEAVEKFVPGKHMHRIGRFTTFALHPKNFRFENQEKGEEVILFLRQHPIVNLPWIIVTLLMVSVPFFVSSLSILDFLPLRFEIISIMIWYLLTTAYVLEHFLGWLFNIYIVTNFRVVDIDFYNLIQKQVSDAERDKIQDITYRMGGVFGTFFNYGDVLIQTAGTAPNFEFARVPDPDGVVRELQEFKNGKGKKNV